MGSADDTPIAINNSFSIRDYVFAARQKDISGNWPFSDNSLQLCIRLGITNVLPPFESHKLVKNESQRKELMDSCCDKEEQTNSCSSLENLVGFYSKQENIEVHNNVRTSNTNVKFNYDRCPTSVPSCKRLKFDKKRKGELKIRSMADILSKARPCTLEELDKINGSNWAIDQHVIYGGAVKDATKNKIPLQDDSGAKSTEKKTKNPTDDNKTENKIVLVKGQILKFKLRGRKSRAQNITVKHPVTKKRKAEIIVAKAQKKGSLGKRTQHQSSLQNLEGQNPEKSTLLSYNNDIEPGEDSGYSNTT